MKKILATARHRYVLGAGGLAVASAAESPSLDHPPSPPDATGGHARGPGRCRKLAFKTAADTIGISPTDLLAAMKGGHSIADVATAHDVDPQTVIDAVINALDATHPAGRDRRQDLDRAGREAHRRGRERASPRP